MDLLNLQQREVLFTKLERIFVQTDVLEDWLRLHLPSALPHLAAGALTKQLIDLFSWASAEDGLRDLLQTLADHPPAPDIPPIVMALTLNEIKPAAQLPAGFNLPAHQRLFAADRPFVNRKQLRTQLAQIANAAAGAARILIINGETRTGKSFAVSLAFACQNIANPPMPIDVEEYAANATTLDAGELAREIVGDADGRPPYDVTKEDEAVPRLVSWIGNRLRQQERWVIIDHCNRKVMTPAARSLLVQLATKLRNGFLTTVRLVLVDFDRQLLPVAWRDHVLHDSAALPTPIDVERWCQEYAALERRQHAAADSVILAREVFEVAAAQGRQADGSWHMAFEQQLSLAARKIMACQEIP